MLSTVLNIRISVALKEWLQKEALRRNMTVSALTLKLITDHQTLIEAKRAPRPARPKAKPKPRSRSKAAVKAVALKRRERAEQAAAARQALVQPPDPAPIQPPVKALTLAERRALMKVGK